MHGNQPDLTDPTVRSPRTDRTEIASNPLGTRARACSRAVYATPELVRLAIERVTEGGFVGPDDGLGGAGSS
jgi:hypothetical protein